MRKPRKRPKQKRKALKRHAEYFVYILRCADGTFYTGYTNNLAARVRLHNNGRGARYIRGKTPATLIFAQRYRYYKLAITAERVIKRKTRKQKEGLIKSSRNILL